MTLDHWLESACADADRRNLPELKPALTALVQATRVLRAAEWNDVADAVRQKVDDGPASAGSRPPLGAGQ